jgi:hypothetical protein
MHVPGHEPGKANRHGGSARGEDATDPSPQAPEKMGQAHADNGALQGSRGTRTAEQCRPTDAPGAASSWQPKDGQTPVRPSTPNGPSKTRGWSESGFRTLAPASMPRGGRAASVESTLQDLCVSVVAVKPGQSNPLSNCTRVRVQFTAQTCSEKLRGEICLIGVFPSPSDPDNLPDYIMESYRRRRRFSRTIQLIGPFTSRGSGVTKRLASLRGLL